VLTAIAHCEARVWLHLWPLIVFHLFHAPTSGYLLLSGNDNCRLRFFLHLRVALVHEGLLVSSTSILGGHCPSLI
jgi:hypothetical protein